MGAAGVKQGRCHDSLIAGVLSRRCSRCRSIHPLTVIFYRRDRSQSAGCRPDCRECSKARGRRHRALNREQVKTKDRDYRRRNLERLREYRRHYRMANQERQRLWFREYHQKNRDIIIARVARWNREHAQRHRESSRLSAGRRHALKMGSKVGHVSFNRIVQRDQWRCWICQRRVTWRDLHLDHVIPLSRGGSHTEDNIRVTHAKCNLRKNRKLPEEMAS